MANTQDWVTTIQFAAIRTVGHVVTNVDVTNAGTLNAEAHVTIGGLLARVRGSDTAQRIAATWRDAALHAHRLPEVAGWGRGNPDAECPAGMVIRLGSDAPTRMDLIPGTLHFPVHIRIQVGPLAWLIMDRAAYVSTRQLWERLEDVLR